MNGKSAEEDDDLAAAERGPAQTTGEAREADFTAPVEDPEELLRQRDDLLARWQRAAADYKNLRRRTADDIDAAVRRATLPLLTNLLLVLDHLDLALATRVESEDARALHTGVKLTRDQFLQVLQQNEVEPIDTQGPFDPARHEAVAALEAPGREPGSILEAVRRGYTWRGQVLRHAHVVVARGPLHAPAAGDEPAREDEA
jgi:molecular chaperone GrpE